MASQQTHPRLLIRAGRVGEPLRVPLIDLQVDPVAKTFLGTDMASASGTLTVQNIQGFAINQFLLIGEPGNQSSEIIKTHASTAPTGTTITLASNTSVAHSAGTAVYSIFYDQVEFSHSVTATGSKSVIQAATNLIADQLETTYNDTTYSAGYYFARFKNSISAAFSDYSDAVPYGGFGLLTARYIIDSALQGMNKTTSNVLSDELGFRALNNFQTEVLREQKRWAFLESFNTSLGASVVGTWSVAAPADLDDQYTNKTAWNFKVGGTFDMTFVDKDKWDEITGNVVNTTLASILNVADATMTLTSSADFASVGTVTIGSKTYSYTANNTSTGVLTLSAVVPSGSNQASGAQVFQNASLGLPLYWTIFGGNLYHYPLVDSTYGGRNYYLDYYKKQTVIIADTDTIVVPDQMAAIYYVQSEFLRALNNGKPTTESDALYKRFEQRKENVKQKDSLGRTFRLKPVVNRISERNIGDSKWQRVQGYYQGS